jgi:hypothetical protein
LLRPVALRGDDQHPVLRQLPSCKRRQPGADILGQGGRAADVEADLNRARNLVDVLPARAGGADEGFPRSPARRWRCGLSRGSCERRHQIAAAMVAAAQRPWRPFWQMRP